MAITVTEKNIGRRVSASSCERAYIIKRTPGDTSILDEPTAYEAMVAYAPSVLNNMNIDRTESEVEEFGENMFYGVAKYKAFLRVPGTFHISFDITGVTTHITQSPITVRYGSNAPDFKGGINVDSDGTINGADIFVPYLTWKVNYTWGPDDITDDYINLLANRVGTVNDSVFKNFQRGTNLLQSVAGQQRDDFNWDLTYAFATSKNKTNILVGDITVASKDGWQYLWVYYGPQGDTLPDGVTPYHRKVPKGAYVETLLDYTDFDDLGI